MCALSRGTRFRKIAAPLTLDYRTPRLAVPALPTADAAPEAQDQGSIELRLNGVLRSWFRAKVAGIMLIGGKGFGPLWFCASRKEDSTDGNRSPVLQLGRMVG